MKIGFVSPHTFSYPGGVQKHTLALKKEFEKRGHQVKLIFPREEIPQKKDKDTILLGGALYMPGNASKINLSLNITPFSIYQKLKKEKFDILHFQNLGLFLPWQIIETAAQLHRKSINILTFHAFLDGSRVFKEFPFLAKALGSYLIPKFDGLIAVSDPVLSQLNQKVKYKKSLEVIPNGVDIDFFNSKNQKIKKFDDEKINILFVGRFEKRKGLIYLVRAFGFLRKKNRNIRLLVVGDGDEKEKIEKYIKKRKILDIVFVGRVREKDLAKYYATADVCCFPSLYGESFGIVLLEAMASGKPIAAFSNKGYKEVLVGKGARFLAEPKDDKELAEKINLLIENEKLREEMGKWGRQEAKKYSWENIADQTLKFYDQVIEYKKLKDKKLKDKR